MNNYEKLKDSYVRRKQILQRKEKEIVEREISLELENLVPLVLQVRKLNSSLKPKGNGSQYSESLSYNGKSLKKLQNEGNYWLENDSLLNPPNSQHLNSSFHSTCSLNERNYFRNQMKALKGKN